MVSIEYLNFRSLKFADLLVECPHRKRFVSFSEREKRYFCFLAEAPKKRNEIPTYLTLKFGGGGGGGD